MLGDGVALRCEQNAFATVACEFRLLADGDLEAVEASIGDLPLAAEFEPAGAAPSGTTAILMLVDTSDPGRGDAVAKAADHLTRLLAHREPHQHFGLARFDSELEVLVPIGGDVETLEAAVAGLTAVGKTTELYRNALAAVRLLAAYPAEQRALYLLSDGLAEDQAYFHEDVVSAANEAGVIVNSLGYPRSVALSVGLQSLRRLADETGGRYLATNAALELPGEFFETPFAGIEPDGSVDIDLARLEDGPTTSAPSDLELVFRTSTGTARAVVQVARRPVAEVEPIVRVIEVEVPKIIEVPTFIEVPVAETTSAQPAGRTTQQAGLTLAGPDAWIMWVAAGIATLVLVLLLVILVLLILRSRRGPGQAEGDSGPPEDVRAKPLTTLAFLQPMDGFGEPHPVNSVAYRIGRHGDNDLILSDPSVSRHHAEIHRRRDGTFTVTDLESMNGVFVNGKRERSAKLSDADLLEIGDVGLTFSTKLGEDIGGEETVMLRTVVPINSLEDTLADDDGDGKKLA